MKVMKMKMLLLLVLFGPISNLDRSCSPSLGVSPVELNAYPNCLTACRSLHPST